MSAGRRLVRTFAVTATLLMLLMVADSTVVRIAFAEPVVSPTAAANNNTPSPPLPPPPPPDNQTQRPVEPGTVTQGWDNRSFAPTQVADHRDVAMQNSGNETSYETSYGNFVLNRSSPYLVHFVSPGPNPQEIAESAFLVLYQGLTLLSPGNGTVDNATSEELTFHYGLYLSAALLGTMTVKYRFQRDTNNITISFLPSVGLPSQYQIVWLTFTAWDAIDTAYPSDVQQRFEDLDGTYGSLFLGDGVGTLYGTGTIEMPGAIIRPYKVVGSPGGMAIRMDVSDAAGDFNTSFGGSNFSFLGFSGNAVLSTFLPAHLSIDPSLISAGVPSTATAYSVQRKTFYDGQRYWLFWQSSTSAISYLSTTDGTVNGPSSPTVRTVETGIASLPLGFTVANYGKTVAVLWVDGIAPKAVQVKTGLIAEDVILWDYVGHQQLPLFNGNIKTPISATFTSQGGELAITWLDDAGLGGIYQIGTQIYKCVALSTGFSPCGTLPPEAVDGHTAPDYTSGSHGHKFMNSIVAPFNDGNSIARIMLEDDSAIGSTTTWFTVVVFGSGRTICPETSIGGGSIIGAGLGPGWYVNGLFTAASSGSNVVFVYGGTSFPGIGSINIGRNCGSSQDISYDSGGLAISYLSAGADENSVYVFYRRANTAQYARILPDGTNTFSTTTIFSSYTPVDLTAAASASHFIPVAFTTSGPNLYYSNFPLPLDGEAAVTNPWATKLGAPLVTDVGGAVSPTTGLLSIGQTLVAGNPAVSVIYREPGLFNLDGTKYSPNDDRYQVIPGIYYDLPWISGTGVNPGSITAGVLHMSGGQRYPLSITGQSGLTTWYNITSGARFTLMKYFDPVHPTATTNIWTLTFSSGSYMKFDATTGASAGNLTKAYFDTMAQNYVTYITIPGTGASFTGTIIDASGRQIGFSSAVGITSYGNAQSIVFTKTYQTSGWSGIPGLADCTGAGVDGSNTGRLQVTDAIGRVTAYWVCKWKLVRLESPNGGRVDYAYANSTATRISQGTDAYSYPLTLMSIYNESGASVKARSLAFNWNFQNGEVVRAVVNTTDKSAVVQGSNEYIFNSAAGTASVRVYDSTGQILYYDMSTLCGSLPPPCSSSFLQDLSGNQHPGNQPGTTQSSGRYGGARQFSSQSAWVTANDGYSTALTPPTITVSTWIKTSSTLNQWAVSKWLSGGSNSHYLLTAHYTSVTPNRPTFHISDGASSDYIPTLSATINDGNWHMLTGTFDGKTLAIYRDGVLDNSKVSTLTSIQTAATATELVLGQESSKLGIAGLQGVLDEVHIFKRALSPEEIGILYTKNALKKGEQQNWYSINGQPHLSEGFVGDETSASVVTQDAIDDWGNQIYHRDALGNETFASYANTNHQNHFYAPGRLTKTGTSNTEFIDFSNGLFPTEQGTWTVTSTATTPAQIDYGTFDKIAPSLKITGVSGGSTKIVHPLTVGAGSRFIEFRAKVSAVQEFDIRFGSTSTDYLKARFGTDGYISFWVAGTWLQCGYYGPGTQSYHVNAWYRFTFAIDMTTSPYAWSAYVNGIDMTCGSPTLGAGASLTQFTLELFGNTGYGWVDDIKMYNNNNGQSGFGALNIGFAGLQLRQSIRLLAEDGSVIDQTMQTVSGTTLWLSFNSALTGAYKYAENGDNAKATVRIYAEDGTLEYQSPLTRFYEGETYTYSRPRAFADETIKTRSGALYWPNTIYADDSCPSGATCSGAWTWQSSPNILPLRGTSAHVTTFDYGYREHYWLNSGQWNAIPSYFIMYVLIPSNKAPDTILFGVNGGAMVQGHCAYWGATPSSSACWGWTGSVYLGPVPAVRDQWVMLVVKSTDIGLDGTWDGMVYGAAGGEVAWDVTTTQTVASWTDASLKVSGLSAVGTGSNNQIEVDYANNNTQIGIGPQSGDSASVLLYNRATGITAFPIQVKIRVFSYVGGIQEYYFSPLKNVWPGDSFRDVGSSSFFDSYVNNVAYWPSDSIHTALLGSRTFSGDCLGSILCYDMETMTETQTAVDTGAVTIQMLDLSGKGSHGTLGGVPIVTNADIGKAAAGLGTTFNVATSDETAFTMPTIDAVSGHWNTVSFWMYWTGTSGQIPFGFSGYNLYFASAYFGFNTANNGDIWGIDNTSLANTRVYVTAEFYNGDGKISKLYINGVQKTLTQKLGTTVSRTASTNAKLASWPGDGTHHFGGTIDQVQVFNRALTDTEILEQYYSRMPGGPQTYLRPQTNGLPVTSRVPYEGTYLYVAATYDSKGNVLSVTDAGRTISGGANITRYAYSTLYGRDYRTQVNRSDGKQIYTAYDFQSGVKYGTLSIDCRRSRTSYDTMGRPTQTSVYDTDANEVLHLDMETATYNSLKDVSCAGNNDSTRGQSVSLSGTTATTGIEGGARSFSGVTSDNIDVGTGVSVTGSATISFWVKPSNINTGCCGVNGQVVAYFQTGSTSDFFVIGYYNSGGTNGIVLASAQATVAASKQSTIPLDLNWHHIVVTKTAGAISSIYIDGVDRTTTAQTYWVGGYSKEVVGASYGGGALTAPLYGSLDEVRLFNVVRSTSEITNLWNFKYKLLTSSAAAYDDVFPTSVTTYDGVSTPRALFYDMSTCIMMPCAAGGKLEDLSGHGNDGTMTGTSNDLSGKTGSARIFNGAGDVITETPASNNGFSKTTITVSVWVKVSAHKNWIDYVHTNWCATGTWNLNSDSSGHAIFSITSASCTWAGAVSTQTIPLNTWTHLVGTYDGTTIKVYVNAQTPGSASSPGLSLDTTSPVTLMNTDDAGSLDEVQIIPRDLTTTEVSDLYNGVEKSHMSKTYQDGLGRTTRSVVMDMFGTKIQTVATLGWNDQPVYAYLPSGQYSAFTYDFLGRTLSSQSPGDSTISGISKTTVSEKTRMIESIDAVGRKAYIKTDLLGRTVETAVWNPQTSAYGNRTNASYNALSEVTVSKDAKGQTMTVYYNSLGKPKMTVFPDSTDAAMRYSLVYYDDNLRPFQTVDVMGRVAVSTYDSIGRVTKVSLRAPPATTTYDTFYDYDSHDDLLVIQNGTVNGNRAATGTATITRTYDSLHRMKTEELRIPSTGTAEFDKTVTYAYDNASKVATITYPISGNPYAYYIYDSLGRVKEAGYNSGGVGLGQGVLVYDSFGRLGSIYYWKGATNTTLQEKYTYDARDRVTQVKVFDTGSTYMQLDYVYNKASEIRWSTDNMYVLDGGGVGSNPKNVTYAYDGNGRLSYSSGPYGSSQATQYNCYDYDAVGNIAHHNVSGTGTPTSCTTGTGPIVYTYNPTGWNQLSSITNLVTSFTYNTAGSMLTKVENSVTTTYSQDFLQQLVKAVSGSNTYTYSYDGLGRRVKTVEPTIGTSYFMYAGSKMLYSKVGTTPTETAYVYVGNKLLLRKEGTLDARYYHQDISPGNVRLITYFMTALLVDARYRYRPFGDMVTPPLAGSTQRFQYAQQEYDSANRLYHMGLRYQDPVVGRFAQRDPIGPGYSYASNNPISGSDRTGMFSEWNNFMHWLGSSEGRTILLVVDAISLALALPSAGTSLVFLAGLLSGAIFMVATYVLSGGTATADQYEGAFMLGFAFGSVIGGVYGRFRVAGEAASAIRKASLPETGLGGAGAEARYPALRGTWSSADELQSRALAEEGGFIGQAPKERWIASEGRVDELRFESPQKFYSHSENHALALGIPGRGEVQAQNYLASAKGFISSGLRRGNSGSWTIIFGSDASPEDVTILFDLPRGVEGEPARILAALNPETNFIRTFKLQVFSSGEWVSPLPLEADFEPSGLAWLWGAEE